MSLHEKTLRELSTELNNKNVSSVELTQHYLDRIEQYDSQLNSFILQFKIKCCFSAHVYSVTKKRSFSETFCV